MRTTLKRGIGRGADAGRNGAGENGYGYDAFQPPGLTPMRRYRVPPPPRRTTRQLVGWIFRWTLGALAMAVLGIAGGLYLYGHETLQAFAAHSTGVKKAQTKLAPRIADLTKPSIALVIGYDKRAGADSKLQDGSRSDTIMLLRADPQKRAVTLLSFPRDLVVPIHCPNQPVVEDRINSAWSRCNATGTVGTVEQLTGVTPEYLITVDFHGFKLLVNKLHGVYMNVDHRYLNTNGGPGGYATINLEPGYQKLDGQQALNFVRFRHTDSDLYRLARQQLFVTSLRERVASGFSPFEALHIVGALKGNVEIGQGGGGALPSQTVLSYLNFAHGLPSGHFTRIAIQGLQPYGPSGAEEIAAPGAVQDAVQQFLNPNVSAPEQANRAALGLKPKVSKALKPSQISTLVLNGTTVAGLARDTSYTLAVRGYRTAQLANQQPADAPTTADAPARGYTTTHVYFDRTQTRAKDAAKALQKLFPGAVVAPFRAGLLGYARSAGSPQTIVVLGSSFDGKLAGSETPAPQPPKHEPPATFSSPGTTLEPLREIRSQLPFRLEVPHVIEKSSRLAQLSPVRVYKPAAGHKAVNLTFVTGAGNVYWDVLETDWNDAPVLAHPNVTRRLGGRTFDFYYSGSHLHMIVLRTPQASYWVTNTLLDELTNETMIAIARGLQPLGG